MTFASLDAVSLLGGRPRRPNKSRWSPLLLGTDLFDWFDTNNVLSRGATDYDGSADYHEITDAAQTGLDFIGESFTLAGWINPDTIAAGTPGFIGKYTSVSDERSYFIFRNAAAVQANASKDGITAATATVAGSLVAGTWTFVAVRYDFDGDDFSISFNGTHGTAVNPGGTGTGIYNGLAAFRLGADAASGRFDGRMDSWGAWNRFLSNAELDAIRTANSGAGKQYTHLTDAEKVGLVSWWDLNEVGGQNARDKHGSNTLTQVSAPPAGYGKSDEIAAVHGESLTYWIGEKAIPYDQPSSAPAMPSLVTTGLITPMILFDGVDDWMSFDNGSQPFVVASGGFCIAWVSQLMRATPANETILGGGGYVRQISTTQTVVTDGTNTRTFTHAAQSGIAVHIINGDATTLRHYLNGVESAASGTSFGAITFDAIATHAGANFGNVRLADIVLVKRKLTDAEVNNLGQFLA